MSPRNLAAQELVSEATEQKQRTNIYTMMLILSFIFIVIACVVLYLELQEYGSYPWWKTGGIAPATASIELPLYDDCANSTIAVVGKVATDLTVVT